jgi:hypothetical protein
MNARTALLKQLVDDGGYPLDEAAIAEAILVRARARRLIPEVAFRVAAPRSRVRSFRHHGGARSFRLARPERRPSEVRMTPAPRAPSLA